MFILHSLQSCGRGEVGIIPHSLWSCSSVGVDGNLTDPLSDSIKLDSDYLIFQFDSSSKSTSVTGDSLA